jgi:hypothetical protein
MNSPVSCIKVTPCHMNTNSEQCMHSVQTVARDCSSGSEDTSISPSWGCVMMAGDIQCSSYSIRVHEQALMQEAVPQYDGIYNGATAIVIVQLLAL